MASFNGKTLMTTETYSETVRDHFENPRNAGDMENPDGVGVRTNPVCGDTMQLMIRVDDGGWITPANLPTMDDEFGSRVALLVIP